VAHNIKTTILVPIIFKQRCISAISIRDSSKQFFSSKHFAIVDFRTFPRNTASKYALNDENYDDD